jgi:hypothetical protein
MLKDFTFSLEVNINNIHKKYGIKPLPFSNLKSKVQCEKVTKVSDLYSGKNEDTVIFLDETKKSHLCHKSIITFNSNINYHCFWCKFSFTGHPIGCPIRYVSSQAVKNYVSNITKDVYVIKENITKQNRLNLEKSSIEIKENEYYETDGIFCSPNCCQAFINDNKNDPIYVDSSMLLIKMCCEISNNSKIELINPAPHWRLLDVYGGHLNISKFRESFNKVNFEDCGTFKSTIKYCPIGTLFENKIKF